ncbi:MULTISPECIES: hypothetical protein [unclassified Streptomyces]|uniref:hypothetical protein n=1 Tax=unclassified Streptomyces TaxID=2593676 RepID=UPI003D70C290
MTGKKAVGRWPAAALTAAALLLSGCTGSDSVDVGELPGVYRDAASGGEIVLDPDGTFAATHVPGDAIGGGRTAPADFAGRWEYVDSSVAADFVYLTVDDGGLGKAGGLKVYPSGSTLEFHPDPDAPPSLVLTRSPSS